jgi:hypothetical protein
MNRVVHFEIQADDLDRAQRFYESAFGWTFQIMGSEFGHYRVVMTGPGPENPDPKQPGINGGMMKRNGVAPAEGAAPNAFTCIIGVDDIDAYIAKVDAAGGKPQTDKMNVPGVGSLRYYRDTEGNLFGMIQPVMPTSS